MELQTSLGQCWSLGAEEDRVPGTCDPCLQISGCWRFEAQIIEAASVVHKKIFLLGGKELPIKRGV